MTRRTDPRLTRWLAAEANGREAEADTALTEMFTELERLAPAAGFADRVVWAAARPAAVALPAGAWLLRGAVAAGLALIALCVPLLLSVLSMVPVRLSPSRLVDGVSAAFIALARWIADAVAFWEGLERVAGWLTSAASAPPAAAVLLASLAVAAAALRALAELIAHERSWSHVPNR